MALGASPRSTAAMVVRQGVVIAIGGVAGGLALALTLSGFLRQYLYEVQPFDPWLYGGIAALLTLVVLLASYIPARRAARLDPLVALRQE